nr:hypothetical protein [Stenotrophomonas pictorum]
MFAHHRVVQADAGNAHGLPLFNAEAVPFEETLGAEADMGVQFNDAPPSRLLLQMLQQRAADATVCVIGGHKKMIDQPGWLQVGITGHHAIVQCHERLEALDTQVPSRNIPGARQPCLALRLAVVTVSRTVYRGDEHLAKQGFVSGPEVADTYRRRWRSRRWFSHAWYLCAGAAGSTARCRPG